MAEAFDIKIDYKDLQRLARKLDRASKNGDARLKRAHFRMATLVKGEAELNAPLKESTLQNSIQMVATVDAAEIFVPRNSLAGAYAVRIHDERYVTWKNLGSKTKTKGARAREKFITRAISDNESDLAAIIRAEGKKALKELKR